MQERFETVLPAGFAAAQNAGQLHSVLANLFIAGHQPHHLLISALMDEVRDKYGSPEISEVELAVYSFEPSLLTGRIRVNYDLRLTFSCSAIVNDHHNQHSYWNFMADKATGRIFFTGDKYGDLRSTADEF